MRHRRQRAGERWAALALALVMAAVPVVGAAHGHGSASPASSAGKPAVDAAHAPKTAPSCLACLAWHSPLDLPADPSGTPDPHAGPQRLAGARWAPPTGPCAFPFASRAPPTVSRAA